MTQKNTNKDELHDLEWYRCCVSLDMGNAFDMDWFRNEENKKELYSVKDIVNYICSRFMGLKGSLNEDSKLSLEKQIRRVMKNNFDLPKTEKRYKYVLGQAEVIYMVNELMSDYLSKLIYSDVRRKKEYDCVETFYKVIYGKDWHEALSNDFEKVIEHGNVVNE